jgi:peptidoglycan/LPS O-acetylase OafA/YrhL
MSGAENPSTQPAQPPFGEVNIGRRRDGLDRRVRVASRSGLAVLIAEVALGALVTGDAVLAATQAGGEHHGGEGDNLMVDWPLVTGLLPVLLSAAGGMALLALLLVRLDRRWWSRLVPLVVLAAVVGVGVASVAVDVVRPFPDRLPTVVWWSLGFALVGVGLAVAQSGRAGWTRRALACAGAVLVIVAAANQVNQFFGEFPYGARKLGQAV